jgi:hypothetical protein
MKDMWDPYSRMQIYNYHKISRFKMGDFVTYEINLSKIVFLKNESSRMGDLLLLL